MKNIILPQSFIKRKLIEAFNGGAQFPLKNGGPVITKIMSEIRKYRRRRIRKIYDIEASLGILGLAGLLSREKCMELLFKVDTNPKYTNNLKR